MPRNNIRISEKGNVFLFILLGVVLFGALSFSVARGFRSDTSTSLSARQTELVASEILNYAARIERTINRLRRNGCSENDISFENPYYPASTVNNRAPSDQSCHVFEPEGGSATYLQIPEQWLLSTSNYPSVTHTTTGHGHTVFIGSAKVTDLGDPDAADVMLVIPWLKDNICEKINDKLGAEGLNEIGVWHQQHISTTRPIREPPQSINTKATDRYCSERNDVNGRAPNTFHYVILAR